MITVNDIEKYEVNDIEIPNCSNETKVCINMNPSPESEYIRRYLKGQSNGYVRFVTISLYEPYYIGVYELSKARFTKDEKKDFIEDISKHWEDIKRIIHKEYTNKIGKLGKYYKEIGKNKIELPDNPPDYSLLKTID